MGLGTDVAGGYSPSMLSAVRTAVVASRALHDGTDNYRHGHDGRDNDDGGNEEGEGGGGGGREKRPRQEEEGEQQEEDEDGFPDGVEDRMDWKEALWLSTLGGARLLGIEDETGSFAVGKAFDALLVDVAGAGAWCGRGMHVRVVTQPAIACHQPFPPSPCPVRLFSLLMRTLLHTHTHTHTHTVTPMHTHN